MAGVIENIDTIHHMIEQVKRPYTMYTRAEIAKMWHKILLRHWRLDRRLMPETKPIISMTQQTMEMENATTISKSFSLNCSALGSPSFQSKHPVTMGVRDQRSVDKATKWVIRVINRNGTQTGTAIFLQRGKWNGLNVLQTTKGGHLATRGFYTLWLESKFQLDNWWTYCCFYFEK